MPIFKLSAAKTMHLLSGNILPRNASNVTCSYLNLQNFPGGETPRTSAYRGMGMKDGEEGRDEKGLKGYYL